MFCIDEKTAIQALDRRDRVLPLSPGRVERHGFEYKRHGTLSLYAALNVRTGEVQGKTTARHTSPDFVEFLGEVVATRALDEEIHVILDNLSTHKTKLVEAFLDEHPNVTLHFTPTYSSWLNQVELWFSKVQRDVLSRGIFTSTADLARKLRRYIDAYSKRAKPFRWKYATPTRRITHGKPNSKTVHWDVSYVVALGEPRSYDCGYRPGEERDALLASFPQTVDARPPREVQVRAPQAGEFRGAQPHLNREGEEGAVATTAPRGALGCGEQGVDFVIGQKGHEPVRAALPRNREHASDPSTLAGQD